MTTDRLEQRLPEILTDLSAPQVPDYTDALLGRTARSRQRPGWTFVERWLPMDIAATPVLTGRSPWRTLGVLALLTLLIAALAIVVIGTQQPRHAPLFGPAANGGIIYERSGDIFVADADLRGERLLIGGPTQDIGMRWSLDGRTIYFGRVVDGTTLVMAADADGSNIRLLSRALPSENGGVEVAPDGSRLVVLDTENMPPTLEVLALDGSNDKTVLPLAGVVPASSGLWRPPDADEIVFLGHPGGDPSELALYRARLDGSALTRLAVQHGETLGQSLTEPSQQISFQSLVLSDDGRTAAYWNWETQVVAGHTCFLHVVDLDSVGDRRLTFDGSKGCESQPSFLDDERLIFESGDKDGTVRLAIATVDGGSMTLVPDFAFHYTIGEWTLAPDRVTVLFSPSETGSRPTQLVDITTGATTDAAFSLPSLGSWQRLAP
jgi:hypothetical protein